MKAIRKSEIAGILRRNPLPPEIDEAKVHAAFKSALQGWVDQGQPVRVEEMPEPVRSWLLRL